MTTKITIKKEASPHNAIIQTRYPSDTKDTPVNEITLFDDGEHEFLLHSGATLHIREVEKAKDSEYEFVDAYPDED